MRTCRRYVLGTSAAARCGFGKVLEPRLDLVIRRRGTRDGPAPVLTDTNHAAPQPCCPVPDLAKVVELTERMGPEE